MTDQQLTDFGNDALYSGKQYAFSKIGQYTKQQIEFLNYLFSDNRHSVVRDPEKQKSVQPEDLKAFKNSGKPTEKPTEKPKETQK